MLNKRYKIAFVTTFNPKGKTSWAGTSRYMARALEKHIGDIVFLGPLQPNVSLLDYFGRIVKKLTGRTYDISHSIIVARKYAKILESKLSKDKYDFIFAPASATALAYLKTSIPIIYYTDTTFNSLYNYYEWFSGFNFLSVWEGNRIEKKALKNSNYLILTSEWTKNSVLNYYNINEDKITLAPMGANINNAPPLDTVISREKGNICKIIFIGMEWERKGGQIAIETVNLLNQMGLNTHITMIGCKVPEEFRNENLTIIEYIDKSKKKDKELFLKLLCESHFLLLPTRAECFGIVFCEASAFAIPSIATDTGGIDAAIKNGENGYRLPLTSGSQEYADTIAEIYNDYEGKYKPLSISSRKHYDENCNWDYWAEIVQGVVKKNIK
ncbi:glycosyltransferase family 4 protein [Bacteroidota bacterium]